MTLAEFKAWFEGYTEAVEGAPTDAQWARIKARVAEIDGTTITFPVYIDRYVQPLYQRPYYVPSHPYTAPWWTTYCQSGAVTGANTGFAATGLASASRTFDSLSAMRNLGRDEHLSGQ